MSEAKLPLAYRDGCAGLLIPLNRCRFEEYYLPWKCEVSLFFPPRGGYGMDGAWMLGLELGLDLSGLDLGCIGIGIGLG